MPSAPVRLAGRVGRRILRPLARVEPLAWRPPRRRAPGARPVVGVVGFYGHGNYGDELFLEVFREHLGPVFELRSLLDPADPPTVARFLGSGTRDAAAILIGGGDIVIPWPTSTPYWKRSYLQRPVFVAGVGVPTWRAPEPASVDRLRAFFAHPSVRFIGCRDPQSSDWVSRNLRPTAPVATAPDLVCALTLPAVQRPAGQPIFGVSVRSRERPDDLAHVRGLCERAAGLGYRVRRIVLATGRVRERDERATDGLGLPDTELIASDDLDIISRAIGECTVIASMKFHGVVVATMYGVPAIATMPTAKTRNFLKGIGRPDLLSAWNDPELPARLVPDLAPIDAGTRAALRDAAVAHLTELGERIGGAVEGSRGTD